MKVAIRFLASTFFFISSIYAYGQIAGPNVVCVGESNKYSILPSSVDGINWSFVSGSGTISNPNNCTLCTEINVVWNTGPGILKCDYIISNGEGVDSYSKTINVSVSLPSAICLGSSSAKPVISGPTSVCSGSTSSYYANLAGIENINWSIVSGNGVISSFNQTTPSTVSVKWNQGPGVLKVTGSAPDGEGGVNYYVNFNLNVRVSSPIEPVIDGAMNAPLNSTQVYIVNPGMANYVWNVSSGGTILSGGTPMNNTITIKWDSQGSKSLSAGFNNNGCIDAPTNKTIAVGPIPLSSATLGSNNTICYNQSTNISVSITGGSPPYSFTVNNGVGLITGYTSGSSISVKPSSTTAYNLVGNVTDSQGSSVSGTGSATITVINPVIFLVSGSGTFCGNGSITLSGSQVGYNYQLQRNGVNVGSVIAGTGSQISWTSSVDQTGIYTIVAAHAVFLACSNTMNGSANVVINQIPYSSVIGGGGDLCSHPSTSIYLMSHLGMQYQLKLNGSETGPILSGNDAIITWPDIHEAGTYNVVSTNPSTGCARSMEGSVNVTQCNTRTVLNNFAFQYRYDARKRMTHKKIPGADWVYMVYDNRDRLVMKQDGEQRKLNKWTFTKFDALNRPIITGIYTHNAITDQAGMSSIISKTNFYEVYNGDMTNHGYSNNVFSAQAFVLSNFEVLTVTYYDNYSFKTLINNIQYNYKADELVNQYNLNGNSFDHITGQISGTKVKIIGTSTYLWAINYFDNHYRLIQSITPNVRGSIDRTTNVYDFVGKVLKTKTTHSISDGTSLNIVRSIDFDHAGRLLRTYHSINGATAVLLTKNEYNELGQLVDKKLYSTDNGSTFKQSIDYRYNIRAWLTSINNSLLISDAGATNDDTNDLFGMNLLYNQPDAGLSNTTQFNGNISAIKWSNYLGLDAIKQRAYNFSYDPMNRLRAASHNEMTTAWNASTSYHENGLQYDLNGNIRTLNRKGASGANMDQLAYTYTGNQLLTVSDAGDITKGFTDGNIGSTDYSYDANGNMITDKNKGITAIAYNHLNLPGQVTKSTGDYIKYMYDATGRKLSQQVFSPSGILKKKTDYVGDFFYHNDTLKFINHEEGRIVMTGALPEYQYNLKDHLGNVRTTFTTQPVSQSSTATFETTAQNTEAGQFANYPSGGYVNTVPTNANTGTNSEYLSGGYNGQVGVAQSFSVMPGDQLQIQAYGKYNTPSGTATNMTGIAAAMLSAFNLTPPVAGEVGTASSALGSWGGLVSGGYTTTDDPKVFVTIILFDRDYNPVDVTYQQLTDGFMRASYTVRQPGYAYMYVSNENPTFVDVYVDDVSMSFTPSPIVQMDDYYPFGLTFNSYQRENTIPNWFRFQGQEHLDDLGLNWDLFKWRNHQPDIGRFFNIDKLAEKYYYNSPYAFSENKVVAHRELEGLESVDAGKAAGGYLKEEITKVENVWNSFVGKVEKLIDGLTIGKENPRGQQKGIGINIYSDSKGSDNKYVGTPDPKSKNYDLEKSVLDGVSGMTKSPTAPSAPKDIGEVAKNVASGIDKSVKAEQIGEKMYGGNVKLDTIGTTGNVGPDGETYNAYYVIKDDKDTIDQRGYVPDDLMPKKK